MASSLPNKLYSCEQTQQLDQLATAEYGLSGIILMKRAGRAAFEFARARWSDNKSWLVLCGGGNNAGDGYVFAALAAQRGHQVRVLAVSDPLKLKGEAAAAYQYAVQEKVVVNPYHTEQLTFEEPSVVVDALLGTGLRGDVRADYAAAIAAINETLLPVLALDVPSGLCADTGAVLGSAVKATATITFIGCNLGLLTGAAPAHTGDLVFDDLAVPPSLYEDVEAVAANVDRQSLMQLLPERAADAHKGQFGHVMVIGGDRGYGGAAILATEAALFSGVGLASLATQADHISAALVRRPEVMALGVPSGQELEPHLKRPDVLVVGPGLGQTPWSEQMLQQALTSGKSMVLDADALSLLAQGRILMPAHQQWILTPHPGEAARLLGVSTADIQNSRPAAVRQLQQKWGGVVILKGAGTLIYDGAALVVAKVGNPGLATGGTGDVLSGVVGALVAQGLPLMQAAQLAVCLHGDAADLAVAETGTAGLLAAELAPYLRELVNA